MQASCTSLRHLGRSGPQRRPVRCTAAPPPGAGGSARPVPTAVAAAQQQLRRELAGALQQLPGLQGVLPGSGDSEAKQRVLSLVANLERTAPFDPDAPGAAASLLGQWDLVFASDGTVVTRTPAAQALASLPGLPGVGISDIQQQLEEPQPGNKPAGAGVGCSNIVRLGLGPFGTWSVRVKGHWYTCHPTPWRFSGGEARAPRGGSGSSSGDAGQAAPGLASEVAFDGLGIRLEGFLGLDLGKLLPELSIAAPRRTPTARANWQTTYCDSEVRIGRGVESKGVFLFRKRLEAVSSE